MNWGTRGILTVALLVAALLASSATAAAPTREAYIKKVDSICKQSDARITPAVRKFDKALEKGEFKQAADHLRTAVGHYRDGFRLIKRVEPPKGDAQTIDRWLRLISRDIRVFKIAASAIEDERFGKVDELLEQSNRLVKRIRSVVGNYGFRQCV